MISLANGLRISATNLDALKSGKIVGAFSKTFLAIDRSFALYPDLQIENSDTITVEFWSECKSCEPIDNTFPLTRLSEITALPIEELEAIFQQRANIFLLALRVYKLPDSIQVQQQATGNFVSLPETIAINEKMPILNDEQFQIVQDQSKDLDLQVISNEILTNNPIEDEFDIQIISNFPESEKFSENPQNPIVEENIEDNPNPEDTEIDWIKTISTLGDRSIKEDKGKNNYQAGTDFENIVKKSLEFLGFTIDESHKGGAGGLDLFCSEPYPIAGECKGGKSIPDNTVEQLNRIAKRHLKENYHLATGLIIGSGEPTRNLKESALASKVTVGMKINIIKAKTLQKLVELKAKYSGSIDLIKLKEKFQAGQIDTKIDEYINDVESEIKLRSHIIQTVKNFLLNIGFQDVEMNIIFGLYAGSNPPKSLSKEELREILIELSSPLAGYLGRVEEGGKKCDRFYFLRDLLT